jgi:hypothetical protein
VDEVTGFETRTSAHTLTLESIDPDLDISPVELVVSQGADWYYSHTAFTSGGLPLSPTSCWTTSGTTRVPASAPPYSGCSFEFPRNATDDEQDWLVGLRFEGSSSVPDWGAPYCSQSAGSRSNTWLLTISCLDCP